MSAHLTGRIERVMAIYTETKKSVLWYFELYLLTLMYLEDKCKQRMCYHFLKIYLKHRKLHLELQMAFKILSNARATHAPRNLFVKSNQICENHRHLYP